jgi:hypothetical protein
MSYFVGDDGKEYRPFGRGGRANLLRGCAALQTHSSGSSAAILSISDKVNDSGCGTQGHVHSESCGSAGASVPEENESFRRLQECPLHVLPIHSHQSESRDYPSPDGFDESSLLPICITEPASPSAEVHAALARDVVLEVFKNQVSALLVRLRRHCNRFPLCERI